MHLNRSLRRNLRPLAKTIHAMARWRRLSFGGVPAIFGNSKPKSGSHLLWQILNGLTQILPYAYVEAEPVRTITREGTRRSNAEVASDLRRQRTGVIGWGYVEPNPEIVATLCQPGRVNYFIYRDPRDLLVSQVHFATDMHDGHGMHAYYRSLPDFGARLKVAISGIERENLRMVSVRQRYETVLEWLTKPGVVCVRFEDLINNPVLALDSMLDAIEKSPHTLPVPRSVCIATLRTAIQPSKSHTFRSGRTGEWRTHFTPEHKRLFIDVAGDLLVKLGYETGTSW
jgi:hypothetical protein